jgi:hypothetical protein
MAAENAVTPPRASTARPIRPKESAGAVAPSATIVVPQYGQLSERT